MNVVQHQDALNGRLASRKLRMHLDRIRCAARKIPPPDAPKSGFVRRSFGTSAHGLRKSVFVFPRLGANLRGLDQLLPGYAHTSFNYLIAGMILRAIVGMIAAFVISSQKS